MFFYFSFSFLLNNKLFFLFLAEFIKQHFNQKKMKPTLIILAAGMGSRYGGLKQLDKIGFSGETIMDYSIYDALNAGFGKVVFVIRKQFETQFSEIFSEKLKGKMQVEFVYQEVNNVPDGIKISSEREKPWGTGHAILVAKNVVNEPFAVINADDFYGAEAFKEAFDFLTNEVAENRYAMCGYELKNTLSDFGSVSRGVCSLDEKQNLLAISERTNILRKNAKITYTENEKETELDENLVVSMNFWAFHPSLFKHLKSKFTLFIKENTHHLKAEFYIPFVIDDLMKEEKVTTKVLRSKARWFGVTYIEDREAAVEKIKDLVKKGSYPEKLW